MHSNKKKLADLSKRQMLKRLAALSVSGWGLGASQHALSAVDQTSTVPAWPLWKAKKAGQSVYVFGETPPRATAWHDQRIETLAQQCGTIWTETNQIKVKETKSLVMQFGLDLTKPLSDRLSEHDYHRLKQLAEIAKVPVEAVSPMRPWLAALTLETAYFATMQLDEKNTAERVLLSANKDTNIKHKSEFTTQDHLLEFMGAMSAEEDLQFLQYTLDHTLAGISKNESIYAAWARGDEKPAQEFVEQMRQKQPALYAKHIVERNRGWIQRFEAMEKEAKPSLVIVGLFHMVGPDSLVNQLRISGWSLERV